MPHICLTYTQGLQKYVDNIVQLLSDELEKLGFNKAGIKSYGIQIGTSCVGGELNADMVHLNLRVMNKAERTSEVIEDWLVKLSAITAKQLPHDCCFTAEVNFLPKLYKSKTA